MGIPSKPTLDSCRRCPLPCCVQRALSLNSRLARLYSQQRRGGDLDPRRDDVGARDLESYGLKDVARHFGDNTAYMLGRVSLNPLRHIDMEARLTMTNMAIEAGGKNGTNYALSATIGVA